LISRWLLISPDADFGVPHLLQKPALADICAPQCWQMAISSKTLPQSGQWVAPSGMYDLQTVHRMCISYPNGG
jgi:hypothetical protein